jgi:hypothetical protein
MDVDDIHSVIDNDYGMYCEATAIAVHAETPEEIGDELKARILADPNWSVVILRELLYNLDSSELGEHYREDYES